MKTFIKITFIVITLLILTACSAMPAADTSEPVLAEYIKISAEDAKRMMNESDVIIVDVRTTEEFEEARIEGSILIPDYDIAQLAAEMLPDKEATILIYCRSGRRSELASRILIEQGYRNVYDFGGIVDWPYETISGE
jgi:rhodanese-related sulfurtransferase